MTFEKAFNNIAEAVADVAALEVITYKGTISIDSFVAGKPFSFDSILDNAKSRAEFKVVACTQSKLDGDSYLYFDQDATAADLAGHTQLCDSANAKRTAVLQLFQSAIFAKAKLQ